MKTIKTMNKKQTDELFECAADGVIAGWGDEAIIRSLIGPYEKLGYTREQADDFANKVVLNVRDALNGDRRLHKGETPATVDLSEEYDIVLHFRDLYNLSWCIDLNHQELVFIQQLKRHGWGDKQVHSFITKAGDHTNYEYAKGSDGNRVLPRAIREQGDRQEYLRNRFRMSK